MRRMRSRGGGGAEAAGIKWNYECERTLLKIQNEHVARARKQSARGGQQKATKSRSTKLCGLHNSAEMKVPNSAGKKPCTFFYGQLLL